MNQELQKLENDFDPLNKVKLTTYEDFGHALWWANKIEKMAKRFKDIVKKQGSQMMDDNNDNKIDFEDYYITKGDGIEIKEFNAKTFYEIIYPKLGDNIYTLMDVKNSKVKELLPSWIQFGFITSEESALLDKSMITKHRKGSLQLREKLEKYKSLID